MTPPLLEFYGVLVLICSIRIIVNIYVYVLIQRNGNKRYVFDQKIIIKWTRSAEPSVQNSEIVSGRDQRLTLS